MAAAACPNSACDNPIVGCEFEAGRCSKCEEEITNEFHQKFQEVIELTDLHLQNMKDLAYLDACQICLEKQKGLFHKFNIKYVKTLDLAFESSIDFGKFEDAKKFGFHLIEPFHKYYGKFHPLTGLLHLKLGKILSYLEDTNEGRNQVKLAYEILKVTHGVQSEIFREQLMPLLRPN
ncbi:hypothetical protein HHI36_017870 [Cryptolaemus montrouzieri]|uniref:Uncharacterized protein n=1 Tax=Cryptolaemus montrouzieri TaxID=559131 RepID=A0ABD2NNV4_9CUCU